jgi:hypothetical protein
METKKYLGSSVKKYKNFLCKQFFADFFGIYSIMLSNDFFDFFPKFLGRISENWTFINVLFYKTLPTFFWEIFWSMIELFIFL